MSSAFPSLTDNALSCCWICPTPGGRSRAGMNQSWSSSSNISWKQRSRNSCSRSSSSTCEGTAHVYLSTLKHRMRTSSPGDLVLSHWTMSQTQNRWVSSSPGGRSYLSVVLLLVLHPHVLSEGVGLPLFVSVHHGVIFPRPTAAPWRLCHVRTANVCRFWGYKIQK